MIVRHYGIKYRLEVTDGNENPVLDKDFLLGLMQQSITLDLSDLMKEFTFDVESTPVSLDSVVSVLDCKEARAAMRKTLKELAEQENIPP